MAENPLSQSYMMAGVSQPVHVSARALALTYKNCCMRVYGTSDDVESYFVATVGVTDSDIRCNFGRPPL